MKRYNEWVANGYKIGASWGLFSVGIPHRVCFVFMICLFYILIRLILGGISMHELLPKAC
jgi:hypothetical protein